MTRAILMLLALPHVALAGIQTGTVVDVRVSSRTIGVGNPTHVRLAGTWQGAPSCATIGYWAIDTDTAVGKNMLATILLARTTGVSITFYGNNQCDLRGDMETAYQVAYGP